MGSKTIQWCDACKEQNNKLVMFWHGMPTHFQKRSDGIEAQNQHELCPQCVVILEGILSDFFDAPDKVQ